MKRLLLILIIVLSFGCVRPQEITIIPKDSGRIENCTFNGYKLYGRIQIVESFPDIRVEVVNDFPDLNVQLVDFLPNRCGEWQIVNDFPDIRIQIVSSFPDIKIKYVNSFPGIP